MERIRLLLIVLGLGITAALAGCATQSETKPDEKEPGTLRWPSPPDPERFRYIGTLRSSNDLKAADEETRLRDLLTGNNDKGVEFGKPYGIASRHGMLYVTDTREQLVHVYNLARRRYFQFGFRREGAVGKPLGIALDDKLNVYVADVAKRRVVVYDALGLYLREIGNEDELLRPTGVGVSSDGSRVYVVDTGGVESEKHRIVVYDGEGNKLSTFGTRGSGPGAFNLPVDATVTPDGTLYVLDAGNFRVQAFDPDGNYLREWGAVGRGYGNFARPKAITSDDNGLIYVVDANFGNVQIFNAEGVLMLPIGRASPRDLPGQYALPVGVAVDELGHVFILDQIYRKVDVIQRIALPEAGDGGPTDGKEFPESGNLSQNRDEL